MTKLCYKFNYKKLLCLLLTNEFSIKNTAFGGFLGLFVLLI